MKPLMDEATAMAVLVLNAHKELADAEGIAAGHLARLILTNDRGVQKSFVVPFRVAAYARKAMGAPTLLGEELLAVVFTSRGITARLTPTAEGYCAIADVLISRLCGEQRRDRRAVRQHRAKLKKGGAQL